MFSRKRYKIFISNIASFKEEDASIFGVNFHMASEQTIIDRAHRNYEATKLIGLISDTHVPKKAICVPKRVFDILQALILSYMPAILVGIGSD